MLPAASDLDLSKCGYGMWSGFKWLRNRNQRQAVVNTGMNIPVP
jgi:hypothetical protein